MIPDSKRIQAIQSGIFSAKKIGMEIALVVELQGTDLLCLEFPLDFCAAADRVHSVSARRGMSLADGRPPCRRRAFGPATFFRHQTGRIPPPPP
jgi:hypothetical protein